jgi:hypothetical protein
MTAEEDLLKFFFFEEIFINHFNWLFSSINKLAVIIIGALTGPNAYTLANNLSEYFD